MRGAILTHVAGSATTTARVGLVRSAAHDTGVIPNSPSSAPRMPSIERLDSLCCPPHISRFVMAVIIDAVNRMGLRWTRADVAKKSLKGIAPRTINHDAATRIVRSFAAPLQHAAPRRIGWCSEIAVLDVGFCARTSQFITEASATANRAAPQLCTHGARSSAALAQAFVGCFAAVHRLCGFADNNQTTPPRANFYRVFEWRHAGVIIA